MGIRGLNGYIKWNLPNARRTPAWNTYAGQRWGVDCQCFMYRARAENLSIITVLASLIVRLRKAGVEPVFVFDGKPPAAKADVSTQRRTERQAVFKAMAEKQEERKTATTERARAIIDTQLADLQRKAPQVTYGDKDDLKKFLYASGVRFITGNGEADDVLAFQCRAGYFQAVVSTDLDMLARGVPLLILPETNDATIFSAIETADVLKGLGLTYEKFVEACMMMGSDYSGKDWTPIDVNRAIQMARKQTPAWADVSGGDALATGAALLRGDGVQWETIVSEYQRKKWDAGAPPVEPAALAATCSAQGFPTEWYDVLVKPVL
jgi:hypothetical protein